MTFGILYPDSDGKDGMSLSCSGCLPPAVSKGADCRCNEPSEGVHITRGRRLCPPDVDSLCYLELALVSKIGA